MPTPPATDTTINLVGLLKKQLKQLRAELKTTQAMLKTAQAERDAAVDLAERVKRKNQALVKANERRCEEVKQLKELLMNSNNEASA